MNGLGAAHPRQWPDGARPVREARNEPEVLAHVLFADQSDGHDPPGRERHRGPEEAFEHYMDTLCLRALSA
jgi:hypothetical protein